MPMLYIMLNQVQAGLTNESLLLVSSVTSALCVALAGPEESTPAVSVSAGNNQMLEPFAPLESCALPALKASRRRRRRRLLLTYCTCHFQCEPLCRAPTDALKHAPSNCGRGRWHFAARDSAKTRLPLFPINPSEAASLTKQLSAELVERLRHSWRLCVSKLQFSDAQKVFFSPQVHICFKKKQNSRKQTRCSLWQKSCSDKVTFQTRSVHTWFHFNSGRGYSASAAACSILTLWQTLISSRLLYQIQDCNKKKGFSTCHFFSFTLERDKAIIEHTWRLCKGHSSLSKH